MCRSGFLHIILLWVKEVEPIAKMFSWILWYLKRMSFTFIFATAWICRAILHGIIGSEGISLLWQWNWLLIPFVVIPIVFFQRFAAAAAEVNGAIYAVGGYDGKEYLK